MASRRVLGFMLAALVLSVPASAQTTGSSSSDSPISGRLFVHFEGQSMTAKDSFDAVTGSNMMKGLGAGLEVQRLWRGVFVRADFARMARDGERVYVFDNEVFPLGVPLRIVMTPIEIAAGWRFKALGSRGIVPYVGGGALFLKYRETSDADASGESVNETYNGIALFGGLEVPIWKRVSAGAEIGWRKATVNSPGGAMAAFGENDLGGVTFRVMISFRE